MNKQCKRKLTEEQIQQVRELYATGEWTQKQLAEKVGVSKGTIGKYVKGVEKPRPTVQERFDAKWIEDENGCWTVNCVTHIGGLFIDRSQRWNGEAIYYS